MNEKNKGIIALVAIIGLIAFLIIIQAVSSGNKNQSLSGSYSTDYEAALTASGKQVLMLGRDGCGWCQKFRPHINYLSSKYGFTYYYADTDKLTTTELSALLEKLGVDVSSFGTPYVAILDSGEKVGEIGGYVEESALFTQLQSYGVIDSSASYVASEDTSSNTDTSTSEDEDNSVYTSLSFPDYNAYKQAYDGGEKMAIVLGQTGCGHCTTFKPIINSIASENNITIHYINLKNYSSEEVQNLLDTLSSYFDGVESWGTPLTLIVENGKVIDSQKGSADKETTVAFLKKNGLL